MPKLAHRSQSPKPSREHRAVRSLRKAGPPPSGVVVITGASSGIGRATAHAFALTGTRLVLAEPSASP
ncbi:SDR family NAD(P)-dependent oxidoreductase [Arthrobacter ginkgonis]|uniref:SDR family NAD(P)-dependent oxidoreductase n=1 Tax=Arthrobacter ginkgonis TaxID=1630594 RepID=UPI0031E72354